MTVQSHMVQASRNRQVAQVLSGEPPISLQWAVTCYFYAGLHYVSAYLLEVGHEPRTHGDRDQCVSVYMKPIFKPYRWLKQQSEGARYYLMEPTGPEFERSRARVDEIEEFVTANLRQVIH